MLGLQVRVVQLPDVPILEESFMGKSWLVCVLMGTLAWGQAQPAAPAQSSPAQAAPAQAPSQGSKAPAEATPAQANPAQASPAPATPAQAPAESKPPAPPPEVPMSAVVLTIKGVCPATTPAAICSLNDS